MQDLVPVAFLTDFCNIGGFRAMTEGVGEKKSEKYTERGISLQNRFWVTTQERKRSGWAAQRIINIIVNRARLSTE